METPLHSEYAARVMEAVQSSAVPAETVQNRPNVKMIALLALGHLCVDTNGGAIAAILPYIKVAQNLSYTAVGILVLVTNLTSSVVQPVFGYYSDRRARRWMLPTAVLFAGLGMGLTGLAGNYWIVMLLLVVMGLGSASYHPEGYRTAAAVAGARKATAISWFSVGGNVGIAIGPPVITFLVVNFGLRGTLGMIIPSIAISAMILPALSVVGAETRAHPAVGSASAAEVNRWGAMAILIVVVAIRSWTQLGFATYIPFYVLETLKAGPERVASMLFVFLGAGAVGTLIGGPMADRWGAKRFIVWGFLFTVPMGVLFLRSSGALAYIFLALFGGAVVATFTTSVVLGQAYLPRAPGMASGLIVGLAMGTGGLAVTLFGRIADVYGVPVVLWICALLPIAGLLAAAALPAAGSGDI